MRNKSSSWMVGAWLLMMSVLSGCYCVFDNTCSDSRASALDVSACSDELAQVCGEDGLSYVNECYASQVGVAIAHYGECEEQDAGAACEATYAPVCGNNALTFLNACEASRASIAVAHEGECETAPDCTGDNATPGTCAPSAADDPCAATSCEGGQACEAHPAHFVQPCPDDPSALCLGRAWVGVCRGPSAGV